MDEECLSRFAIHEASRDGRLTSVESLLNANPRLATLRDDDERLPIHWALSHNRPSIVELLVSRKDFDPDIKDGSGWTPLMIAASLPEGDGLVDLLLRKEADVNVKSKAFESTAARYNIVAQALIVMWRSDFQGQTALHFCTSKNNIDVARKLLSYSASTRIKDKRGQLALHRAAAIGSVPMIKLLLKNKSPLNATDAAGYTALHHTISEGHGDSALELLKAGAEIDKIDVDGHLAIDLAPDAKIRKFIIQSAEREGIDLS